mmetsp:Transcript_19043/g.27593  ORF Transcript_19043/g.27593 Transcript_19043/m.27593 type:complete len:281 (+) Transcript_19043:167-1009(+)
MSDSSKTALPRLKRSRWPVALLITPIPAVLFYVAYNGDSGFRDRVEKAIPGFREYARHVSSAAEEDLGGSSPPSGFQESNNSKPSGSILSKIYSSFTYGNSRSGDIQHENGGKTTTRLSSPSSPEPKGSGSHESVTHIPMHGSQTVEENQAERWSPKLEENGRTASPSSLDPDGSISKSSAPDQKTEASLALSTRFRDALKGLLATFSSSTSGKDSKSIGIPPSPDVQSSVGDSTMMSTADEEVETNALKMELESLEESITQLRYELHSRSKWEAVRLEV